MFVGRIIKVECFVCLASRLGRETTDLKKEERVLFGVVVYGVVFIALSFGAKVKHSVWLRSAKASLSQLNSAQFR